MTGLEQAFYIVGLVYMGISLAIILAILTALIIIRKKVISVEKIIKEKTDSITAIPNKIIDIIESIQALGKTKG